MAASRIKATIEMILPVDELSAAGEELAANSGTDKPLEEHLTQLQEFGRGVAQGTAALPFDANVNPEDREAERQHGDDLAQLNDAREAEANAHAVARERSDQLAAERKGRSEPKLNAWVVAVGAATIAISLAPTFHDRVFYGVTDDVLAWTYAFGSAAAIATFIAMCLVSTVNATAKRSAFNVGGLIAGIVIGVGAFMVRVSEAGTRDEVLFAAALTAVEIGAVLFLDWIAAGLRAAQAEWIVQEESSARAQALLNAANDELTARRLRVEALEAKCEAYRQHLEARAFRANQMSALEGAAIEFAVMAYKKRVAANRGRKVGANLNLVKAQPS